MNYRVHIPPPSEKIKGCLISRDPTREFLVPLQYFQQCNLDRKGLLCFDAPPRWLYDKIEYFLEFPENSDEKMKKIRYFLDRECYWTHLQKCPTCKSGKKQDQRQINSTDKTEFFQPFQYPIAKKCANQWFGSEFDEYGLEDKIIITCGRDVEKLFSKWSKENLRVSDLKVINFPHPSGANCGNGWSWNKNTHEKERINSEINRLLDLV